MIPNTCCGGAAVRHPFEILESPVVRPWNRGGVGATPWVPCPCSSRREWCLGAPSRGSCAMHCALRTARWCRSGRLPAGDVLSIKPGIPIIQLPLGDLQVAKLWQCRAHQELKVWCNRSSWRRDVGWLLTSSSSSLSHPSTMIFLWVDEGCSPSSGSALTMCFAGM